MTLSKDFNYSYWELKHYFKVYDLIIIGGGIIGLSTAISFKKNNPSSKILILEKGVFPNGASTKNAGFACFGSPGELLDDLDKIPEKSVWETVKMRWDGLQILRKRLTDKNLDFKSFGGFELFDNKKKHLYCKDKISFLNKEIKSALNLKNCYKDIPVKHQDFKNISGIIFNKYEGQLDTAKMMSSMLLLAQKNEVEILNSVHATHIGDFDNKVEITTMLGTFKAKRVVVATNGFANQLLNINDVKPARAQVLITRPIKNLKIKGTYHFQNGYYYFRNIDNRILFGGGRNLDFKGETTHEQGLNKVIQKQLDQLLKTTILPGYQYEIEHRWSGIMGVGSEKKPIIKRVSTNVLAAVRMGGMGIAIGSWVGEKAAEVIS